MARPFFAFAIVVLAILAVGISLQADSKTTDPRPPHAAALDLVFRKAGSTIRKANPQDWWHDTKQHQWTVQRPFAPGVFDSTHLFNVTYKIDDKAIATWHVDTRKGEVKLRSDADK